MANVSIETLLGWCFKNKRFLFFLFLFCFLFYFTFKFWLNDWKPNRPVSCSFFYFAPLNAFPFTTAGLFFITPCFFGPFFENEDFFRRISRSVSLAGFLYLYSKEKILKLCFITINTNNATQNINLRLPICRLFNTINSHNPMLWRESFL